MAAASDKMFSDAGPGLGLGLRWRKHSLKPIRIRRSSNTNNIADSTVEEEEEEPLSPAARMFHEPRFNVYVVAILGCTTKINPDIIKINLGHTLLKHPRFSSLLVEDQKQGGKMKWVRTTVNLENHVIVPELDPNMDLDSAEKFVEDYVSGLSRSTNGMSRLQPLWDLHLLNIKTSDAAAIGAFRIHHSLGDGASLMSLLLACTRQSSDPEAVPTIPTKKTRKNEPQHQGRDLIWRFLVWFWWIMGLAWHTLVDVLGFTATAVYLKDTETPIKGGDGVEFTARRFIYRTVSLDDIKMVKNAINNATINDVVFGITQAGLARYLNRTWNSTYGNSNLPKNIRLRSTLLVNLRPATGIQGLADMMEKDVGLKWGNWIGYVLLPVDTALHKDPLESVRKAKATIDRKKYSLEAIFTFSISEIILKLFGIKIASALSHTTLCFSNLVGPLQDISFYGHQIAFLAPGCYGQPHGLMINFQSYVNKMTFLVSADQGCVPDPHQLCNDIVESLNLARDAVITRAEGSVCP